MTRKELAMNYFKDGYNCAQSVVLAFEDIVPIEKNELTKLASSFGAGMGRLREVCGAVSGMFIVVGLLYGYDEPKAGQKKEEHYERIQKLAKKFEDKNGSIVCRNLLGLNVQHDSPKPEARTSEYYKERPCMELVGDAAEILDEFLEKNKKAE